MITAIDGPVASGKSTAARDLARELGFHFFDTGAVYRAITVLGAERGADPGNAEDVASLLEAADVRLEGERTILNGLDISERIRLPEVSASVRPYALNPEVRAFVNAFARRFAEGRNIVVEGRDMGTVVFPDAEVKIYITAAAEDRARRRWEELERRGTPQPFEDVLKELQDRDRSDMNRSISPLKAADDAVIVDSTGWEREKTLARLREIVTAKLEEVP